MKQMRSCRDCPRCGAHKGFACHTFETMPECPQLELAPDEEEATFANLWNPGPPGDEQN